MSCGSKSFYLFMNLPGAEVCPTSMKNLFRSSLIQNVFRVGLVTIVAGRYAGSSCGLGARGGGPVLAGDQ